MSVVTQIVVTVIGSGIGAGIVTFVLNFMKAERDFLRSKLETLYLAVHKYTVKNTSLSAAVLSASSFILAGYGGQTSGDADYIDQMIVIIDLYFPQLRAQYDEFRELLSETLVVSGELNVGDPEYKAKYLMLCRGAEKFEKAIVKVSRSHWLLRWGYPKKSV
jgi:hypothetical protein